MPFFFRSSKRKKDITETTLYQSFESEDLLYGLGSVRDQVITDLQKKTP